jgi:signal transduction histidine kinase
VRTVEGGDIADVPPWMERVSLERSTGLAVAVLDRVSVNRPAADVPPIRRRDLEERGLRQLTTMPLIVDDVVVGTLTVGHRTEAPWDEHSLKLLENTAAQLAVELAHARLLDAERRRADDLDAINELGTLVAQHLEPRAVLATAARELARLLDVARVHVLLSDEKREYLRGQSATEEGVSDVEIFLPAIHAVVYALRMRAPVVVDDAENDPRTNKAMVERVGAKSMAIVPLVAGGQVIGAIVLIETRRKRNFTENEMARVTAVANVVASAASNATTFEDLRRSYEALECAQAELVRHERLAALGELSASIAHEVRNPVAIIFNSLTELRRLERGRADARMLLDIVEEETTRLNRIVRDLLDFVRPYEAQTRKVELGAVVRGAVEAARRALPEPAVRIETQLSPGEREIAIDETMFQQALLNVIVNAVQASPPGATVEVRAEVVSSLSGETLRCEVTDEGVGLDPDTSGRIFEPFFTTKATGTGLGLALVRRLMDGLGGTVVAESRPTAGALFRLTVPLKS